MHHGTSPSSLNLWQHDLGPAWDGSNYRLYHKGLTLLFNVKSVSAPDQNWILIRCMRNKFAFKLVFSVITMCSWPAMDVKSQWLASHPQFISIVVYTFIWSSLITKHILLSGGRGSLFEGTLNTTLNPQIRMLNNMLLSQMSKLDPCALKGTE